MINHAFRFCADSEIPEAKLAYDCWDVDIDYMLECIDELQLTADKELSIVYFEWLNEECAKDLRLA